jgi:hypothetical protein
MPRRAEYDAAAVSDLFASQDGVATHAQLAALDMPLSTVTHRIGVRGPWQRILPGVVLCHLGVPTRRQLMTAALLYAGECSVITGLQVLRSHGVRAARPGRRVHVLIPEGRRRVAFDYLTSERTRRLPKPQMVDGVRMAPIARAVVDACRQLERLDDVRELVAEVVQSGLVRISELVDAVRAGARQRTALTNAVLREMAAGIRSVAEARAREIIMTMPIPQPEWNIELRTVDGQFLARPDAYWELLVAAIEIDSMRWHLSPAAYRKTQQRQRRLVARAGVLLLPVAPADVVEAPDAFRADVAGLVHQAADRTPPTGLVVVRRQAA